MSDFLETSRSGVVEQSEQERPVAVSRMSPYSSPLNDWNRKKLPLMTTVKDWLSLVTVTDSNSDEQNTGEHRSGPDNENRAAQRDAICPKYDVDNTNC